MRQRPDFRVATRYFRRPTRALATIRASGHLSALTVGGIVAAFIAASGGFSSEGIAPTLRFAVIGMAAAFVTIAALATRSLLATRLRLAAKPVGLAVMQVALLTPAAVIVCWTIAAAFQGADTPPLLNFLWPCFLTIALAESMHSFVRRRVAVAPTPAQPKLACRLPPHLRSSQLLAVEAEDHFLRVHTSTGQALLPMRFSDALKLLRNEPGAQTHRSWWVSKSAVSSVQRGNGRARLTLQNGLEVPASRQFARRLREEGWY